MMYLEGECKIVKLVTLKKNDFCAISEDVKTLNFTID